MKDESRVKANELTDKVEKLEKAQGLTRQLIKDVSEGYTLQMRTHSNGGLVSVPNRFAEPFLRLVEQENERLIAEHRREIEAL